jgi:acetyl-CoA carboxylase biotin carboxyl carrier protein
VDLKEIKAIIDLMKKNSISEFEMEEKDFKIKLKRGVNGMAAAGQYDEPQLMTYAPQPVMLMPGGSAPAPANGGNSGEADIKSPMIGTFYRAPSPEAGNYIEVGMEVVPETVVCIIEAMKVMNEIKAEAKGVITQIIVENAKPVEFGQPLFKIRPT